MIDHFNHGVDAGSPPVPEGVGDYFYGQDQSADFWYLSDLATRFRDVFVSYPVLISGGVVSAVTNWQVNVSAAKAVVDFLVSIRDTTQAWGVPPQMRQEAVAALVSLPLQSGLDIHSGGDMNPTADGTTVNYLCLSYAEVTPVNGTRTKAKKAGSYAYAKAPSFSLSCGPVDPSGDDTKVLLATMTVTAAGVITIVSQETPTLMASPSSPPTGFVYFQGPHDASPATLWPGTTWSDVSYEEENLTRRVVGSLAGAFFSGTPAVLSVSVSGGVPSVSIVSGGSGYLFGGSGTIPLIVAGACTTQAVRTATVTNGVLTAINTITAGAGYTSGAVAVYDGVALHGDLMQQITGSITSGKGLGTADGPSTRTGAFSSSTNTSNTYAGGGSTGVQVRFDSADSPGSRVGAETSGAWVAVKKWRRTA